MRYRSLRYEFAARGQPQMLAGIDDVASASTVCHSSW